MIQIFVLLPIFLSVVLAQSSNSTTDPLIPTNISTGCLSYLNSLDTNNAITACTTPIISATTLFAPGANASSVSASDVNNALENLCSTATANACPQSVISSTLGAFYQACSAELTSSPNVNVATIYDVLYVLTPLRQAICSKSNSGSYCIQQLNTSTISAPSAANIDIAEAPSQKFAALQEYLYVNPSSSSKTPSRRSTSNSTAALIPNTTTYGDSNLVFLFLQPTMPESELCTTCTRDIFTSYITFESGVPYAPGLASSLLMSGQSALYSGIESICGASFLTEAVQAAGGISSSILSASAPRSYSQDFSVLAVALGTLAVALASL